MLRGTLAVAFLGLSLETRRHREGYSMFVTVTDYHGNQIGIDPNRIIKIRQSGIADEPKKTVFIDFASGGTFAKGKLKEIVKLFGTYIRLAALHAPNEMPIFLNADGIAAVEVDEQYDGRSVAVVGPPFENLRVPARNKIALNETVAQAKEAIESARRVA
jgi:hypothetical protein